MNEHFRPDMGPAALMDGRDARIDLAHQIDFELGGLRIRPSICEVVDDNGPSRLEPRVMQVLVALARAEGSVVSRDDLIVSCWGGRIVGEDAINRCVARLRRLFETSGSNASISTFSKVGYRLDAVGGGRAQEAPRPALKRYLLHWPVIALVLALLVAGAAVVSYAGRPAQWIVAGYRPFAAETLIERHPAFSPDGRTLAFSVGPDTDSRRIMVRPLAGGAGEQVSNGPGDDYAPAWSPAADRIAFARYVLGRPCQIVARPMPAGPETVIGRCRRDARTRLAWSRSGRELYFTDVQTGGDASAVKALDLTTGGIRDLTHPSTQAGESDAEPALSPDGGKLAFVRDRSWGAPALMTLDLNTGAVTRAPTRGVTPGGVAWTPDGKSLVVASDRGGDYSLWLVQTHGDRQPRRLLTGLRAIGRVAVSRGGDLALETDSARINLERMDEAGQIAPANSSDWDPDIAPDGAIAFISNRGGGEAVWMLRPGQPAAQATFVDFDRIYGVRWSPDGRRIAFVAARGDEAGLYVANADGLGVIRLKATGLDLGEPIWTADGSGVIVPSRNATGWRLIQSSLDGRGPIRVVSDYGWVSVRVGDGALFGVRSDAPGVWRVQRDGRRVVVADGVSAANAEDWAVARGGVYVLKRSGRNDGDLYSSPLAGGPARLVGHLAHVSDEPGLAVDPRTGAPVFPRVIVDDSDIGLMTLKR